MKWFAICFLIVSAVSANEFSKATNLFASTLYKEVLNRNEGNFLASPFSAETALSFIQSGCKGDTAEEIRHALLLPLDKIQIESDTADLIGQLKNDSLYHFHLANKMYVQQDFDVRLDFQKTTKCIYHADSANVRFADRVGTAKKMNTWVEDQTNGTIKGLVDLKALSDRTRVVVLSVLFLKGHWRVPFSISVTRKGKFYKGVHDMVQVDVMHHYPMGRNYFNFFENRELGAKFLELPLEGDGAGVVFVLPKEVDGLASLENRIDEVLAPQNFAKEYIYITIPKFKVETKINLKELLQNLGVKKVFDKASADLSAISGGKGDLVLNTVLQKSYMDVNEDGVVAAAATYGASGLTAGATSTPKEFFADHPFIFYIKIKGVIVFVGRITDPSVR